MANEKPSRGAYGEVVARLQEIVQSLEGGDLSLEDSLDRFSEGIQLVKRGEKLLSEAEKRIEQLLSEDGRVAPLRVPEEPQATAPAAAPVASANKAARRPPAAPTDDEDIPF